MHYYRHHIGDFVRDTARLSDSQCIAYLRMIWMYYEDEKPLEDDPDAIAFKIGASASDVKQILKHFFFIHDGRWHQGRCDEEIVAFRSKSDKAKDSAKARWKNVNAMRTHTERNADEPVSDANHKPITNNQGKDIAERKRSAEERGARLSKDWVLPKEWGEWALNERPDLDRQAVRLIADKFSDYWWAQPLSKARKADWFATWRNWVRNDNTKINGSRKTNEHDPFAGAIN